MHEDTVVQIKYDIIAGELTQEEIGDKYGVSRSVVSNIATARSYKEVGPSMTPFKIKTNQRRSLSVEEQNVSLIGQLANVTVERNKLRRQLKSVAQDKASIDLILEQLAPNVGAIPSPGRLTLPKRPKGSVEETLVLVLSDTHLDEVVTPQEVEGLENFNFIVGARRCENLIESTLKFTQETLGNFRFKRLVIFGLGDYGSFAIHDHTKDSFFGDVHRNCLAIGQLFGCMIAELAPYFEVVDVYNITGNHGRMTEQYGYGKKDAAANYDDLTMRITELHCREITNVKFHFPEGMSAIVDVEGYNFHLSHGHTQKGGAAAWGRAKRMSQTLLPLHGGTIDYVVQGHYHTAGLVSVSGGATLIGNGALLACDQYSLQSLGEASQPSQYIFGVHKDRGVTWRLPVQVSSQDDVNGPQRYDLPCLRDWDHV